MSTQADAGPVEARFVEALLSVQRLVSAGAPAAETYQAIIDHSPTPPDEQLLADYAEHVGVVLSVARAGHAVEQAFTDSLTGLGNRALLLDRLEHELARADRGGEPVTVLFIDLDRFKLINDSLGHLAGDKLLEAAAERLRHCVRDSDVCARLGGDEFAVVLTGASDPNAVADRIIEALQRSFTIDGHEVFIGVSIGIATGREDAGTLLRNADVAMYQAKHAGTGRRRRFEPSMHEELLSRLDLEADLRRAVERGEFELHYQPLYDLRTSQVTAFESLIRWRHPVRGLVPPIAFIPLLAGILSLGRHLGLTTVAEGVEHQDQRRLLLEFGCDLAQGYLMNRPLTAGAASELIVDPL